MEIVDKINKLAIEAAKLEPDKTGREKWETEVFTYADDFLTNIDNYKTYVAQSNEGEKITDLSFDDEGKPISTLINIIKENVDTPGINPASGGHLGYIPGGGIYTTALGDYLASVFNRYAGIYFANPGAVRMENALIRWMNKLIGYPESALGNLTSGGSIANLIAIVTARDAKGINSSRIATSCIYLTSQVHHSIQKAIRIAGLRETQIHVIPMDSHFRMDTAALLKRIKDDSKIGLNPFLVIGSAGTTDTGAIDDLDSIASVCRQYNLWFHVDAAYGGFFLLVEDLRAKLNGIEQADSISIDPHKGLFLAYGSGAVLIKDSDEIHRSHVYRANYMQDAFLTEQEPSPADLSPELTKHFRGMRMWLSLQLHGLKPFKACLEEKILLCRYFYQKIQELGFEVGPEPELSVCIYRYRSHEKNMNEFNAQLVKAVQDDGRVFISSTTIDGIFWLRLAVLSFRTHIQHIDILLEILKSATSHIEKELNK